MGLRGPTRDPNSIRGMRENGPAPVAPVQEVPKPPTWLTPPERKMFRNLVDEAIAAGTPLLKIDAHSFAMIARLMLKAQTETDGSTLARLMRTLLPWMQAAGLTAIGRARLGIKQVEKKKSPTAKLLEMRRKA